MTTMDPADRARRRWLKAGGAMTAGGLFSALARFALPAAHAQAANDYKALVCVFLYGGNDGNNTVVPIDDYASYAAVRAPSGVSLGQGELAPITPASLNRRYGLHPGLAPLAPLFAAKQLAVVCNVGTLVAPLSKAQYNAGQKTPRNLFSHSDQQLVWQGQLAGASIPTGFGGRLADVSGAGNAALAIPGVISFSGHALFTIGATSIPLALPDDGGNGLSIDTDSPAGKLRFESMQRLLTLDRDNEIVARAGDVMALALKGSVAVSKALNAPVPGVDTAFAGVNSSLADQLRRVATLIAGRGMLDVKRQVFFVSMGGYDTHAEQLREHGDRMDQLGRALAAFHAATVNLGVASQVTAFTASDFGRTFRTNANNGSDHAWGSHALVLGGSVRGGEFYGKFPSLALGGADDSGSDGVWIPTTAIDQFGATLAAWFGVVPNALPAIFPNLPAFASATLGFV